MALKMMFGVKLPVTQRKILTAVRLWWHTSESLDKQKRWLRVEILSRRSSSVRHVKKWRTRSKSWEHSSIIYFLTLKNHHGFSSWKFIINFQQHSFVKCKVTIQIFNSKKNKLTVEICFFFKPTFFVYNTLNVLLQLKRTDKNGVTCAMGLVVYY